MQKQILKSAISFLLMALPGLAFAQFSFTNANNELLPNSSYHSGNSTVVCDWNKDGLDDLIVLDEGTDVWVEIQNSNGSFTTLHIGDFGQSSGWAWGMAAGDFDQNGYLDVLAGNGSVKLFMTDANGAMGAAINLPLTTISTGSSTMFLQNVTLGDFNNDGWLDIYGCHDVGESKMWINDGAGSFTLDQFTASITGNVLDVTAVITGTVKIGYYLSGTNVKSNTRIVSNGTGTGGVGTYILSNSSSVVSTNMINNIFNVNVSTTDDSGNYGTTWSDYDNDNDLDFYVSKCRQPVNQSADMRRHDVLHINDGTYTFNADFDDINDTDQDSLLIDLICPDGGAQTWTTNFGDFDNDGDFDMIRTSYTQISELWENTGGGMFSDITVSSGFDIGTTFELQSQIEDFDNDGYQDIILSGDRDIMFHNNGNMTFTISDNTVFAGDLGSFATGDLNHDGAIDVFGIYHTGYNNPSSTEDVIYLNNGNANHWVTFNLVGTVSNHGAVGAKITIYTALGMQIREARAGESYGTQNTFNLHFGLGTLTTIDSAIIHYPSGIINKLFNLSVDQFITNVETGGCTIESGNITYTGSNVICPGQSLTLTAPAGFTYLWFDGSTNQTIDISTPGNYSVQVSNGSCFVNTPAISVTNDSQNTPVISTNDALDACMGTAVTLTSTPAASYLWSNGATTQSISVTQADTFSVQVPGTGVCPMIESNEIINTPTTVTSPVGTDDFISAGSTATLQATGTDVHWFDLGIGGTELGAGNSFITPALSTTTTYFAENQNSWGGGNGVVGEIYHTGTSFYSTSSNTNPALIFDVLELVTLTSVKVLTDTSGTRRFMLLDNTGAIIDSLSVFVVSDSMIVTLNFEIPAGTDYSLTTDAAVNMASIGTNTPRLQRSTFTTGYYPYILTDFVTLTGNSIGNASYYYFYDMHFEKPVYTCVSDRIPVTAHVETGISSIDSNIGVTVYPNPSEGLFTIQSNFDYNKVEILDLLGRKILTADSHLNEMNLSNFSKGTYLIQLTDSKNTVVRRQLIIQ